MILAVRWQSQADLFEFKAIMGCIENSRIARATCESSSQRKTETDSLWLLVSTASPHRMGVREKKCHRSGQTRTKALCQCSGFVTGAKGNVCKVRQQY